MTDANSRSCPDCSGTMRPIRMIDQQLSTHHPMVYTVPEAQRGFWTSKYPIEGSVGAVMCEQCGLIKLYGQPSEESSS